MKPITFFPSLSLAVCLIFGALVFGAGSAYGGWQLVWSDEFTNVDGSSPDPTNWGYDTGGGGWGNGELETYTTTNATIQNSQLVIQVDQIISGGTTNYTSTRMKTQGLWSWTYGRIEARIKIPRGQGIWPAFWMLGTNFPSVSWPTCGEVDIMENIGKTSDQGTDHGTIHGPQNGHDYNSGVGVTGTYTLTNGAALADDFHIYAIEWTTNQIKWFLDTTNFFTATPASLPSGGVWVFTAPQFIILNVAVGGNWPGYPDATTVFPQQMLVDYVRVYNYVVTEAPDAPTGLTVGAGNAATFLSWNASAAASAYNVKRAMNSGGPYTTIASPTANSYVDTGVSACSSYYYVVSATNSIGESANSSEAAAALGAFALAVNSGGGAAAQFIADTNFSGGYKAGPSTATIDTSAVTAPAPQAVYQTERYGANFTYTFTNLTQGLNYKVRLHFAEIDYTAAGQRVFNVFINGNQVLTNFDIIAASGAAKRANIQEFTVAPTTANTIVIQYTVVTGIGATSSGIEILLPLPAAPTAGYNSPIYAGMTLNLTASTVPGATYSWAGPNGFTSTDQNPSIANATTNASGLYGVTVTAAGCTSPAGTTTVVVNPVPPVSCQWAGSTLTLSWPGGGTLQMATNLSSGQWYDLTGITNPYPVTPTGPQQFYRLRLP